MYFVCVSYLDEKIKYVQTKNCLRVSDKVGLKPVPSALQTSHNSEISLGASFDMILSIKRIKKGPDQFVWMCELVFTVVCKTGAHFFLLKQQMHRVG